MGKKTAPAEAEAVRPADLIAGRRSDPAAVQRRDAHADKPPRNPTHVSKLQHAWPSRRWAKPPAHSPDLCAFGIT